MILFASAQVVINSWLGDLSSKHLAVLLQFVNLRNRQCLDLQPLASDSIMFTDNFQNAALQNKDN